MGDSHSCSFTRTAWPWVPSFPPGGGAELLWGTPAVSLELSCMGAGVCENRNGLLCRCIRIRETGQDEKDVGYKSDILGHFFMFRREVSRETGEELMF